MTTKMTNSHWGVVLLLSLIVLPGLLQAQSKVATTSAQFLGIAVGARAIGMGGAYVAEDADVSSLYWNPGAIAQTNKSEFAFVNTNWLVDTKFQWFGFMLNLDGENAIGVSLTQLNYGESDVNTVAYPNGTGEKWDAKDLAIGFSYARRLTDRFSIGGTAKYIDQRIWNESASTFAFDAGLLYVTNLSGLRIGMSMSNFGGDLQLAGRDLLQQVNIDPTNAGSNKTLVGNLKTDSWPTPLLFRVGVAADPIKTDLLRATIAIDALRPNDNVESVNVGAEVAWQEMVFFQAGYQSLLAREAIGKKDTQQQGLTLGVGVRYTIDGVAAIGFNYAYQKFGLFGNLSTIGLSIVF
jgi:opacity protein-like surface antigen